MTTTLPALIALLITTVFATAADPLDGKWERSDKQEQILLKVQNGRLNGYLIKVKDPKRTHDSKNPNSKLRKRKLIGLKIISGFTKGSDGKWTGGTVYNSAEGKTHKGTIWLESGKLMMRISMFSKTAQWNRIK